MTTRAERAQQLLQAREETPQGRAERAEQILRMLGDDQLPPGGERVYDMETGQWIDMPDIRASLPPSDSGIGLTDALVQGATFGFGDEAGAAGGAVGDYLGGLITGQPIGIGEAYQDNLSRIRQGLDDYASRNVALSGGAQAAGGLGSLAVRPAQAVTALPSWLAGFSPRVTPAGRAAEFIGTGTAAGAAAGAGHADEESRAAGAVEGGALGGLLGAVIPAATAVVRTGRNLAGLLSPTEEAYSHIGRAITRDSVTPDELAATVARADADDVPLALADMAGENMQELGFTVAAAPGAGRHTARTFLDERQAAMPDRFHQVVDSAVSAENAADTVEQLIATRARTAAPLYEAAYAHAPVPADAISQFMERPAFQSAYRRARTLAANDGITLPTSPEEFGWQTLDYMKRALDDQVSQLQRAGRNNDARILTGALSDFRAVLDDINPDYAAARAAYAGPTVSQNAVDLGRQFIRGDLAQMERQFADLSPGEQDFFRIGVAAEIRRIIDTTADGRNVVQRALGTRDRRDRLRVVLGDDVMATVERWIADERLMADTRYTVTGGSQTAGRLASQDDAGVLPLLLDTAQSPRSAILGLLRTAARRGRGINEATAARLGGLLFDSDQAANAATVAELVARMSPSATLRLINPERQAATMGTLLGNLGAAGVAGVESGLLAP